MPNRIKNTGEVVHARIAGGRQHAVETLAGFVGQLGKLFKAHGCIDEVTQNKPRSARVAA